jgi:hypothetical protein
MPRKISAGWKTKLTALMALSKAVGCYAADEAPAVAVTGEAVINGTVANARYTGVGQLHGGGCSAVLVAPRVMLTSGHCVRDYVLGCTTLAANPLNVVFAENNGGWAGEASYDARTVAIEGMVARPEVFDLSQCDASDTYNCSPSERKNLDHSKELVVLYLADDAPAGAVPLPIMVHPSVDTSHFAAEVGKFSGLTTWVNNNDPVVTTVGYGVGSHAYTVDGAQVRGRDYGVQRWIATTSTFANHLGAADCNSDEPSTSEPGVVVAADGLSKTEVGNASDVAAGADFSSSNFSHSGEGDSGGPILVGKGSSSNGVSPTVLPAPSAASSYDVNRSYIAGTASLWVGTSTEFRTAFTPTWTLAASNFLKDALHDTDQDGWADPVDEDIDGDGCNNGADQHPEDRWVRIGTVHHLNCRPNSSPWLGDESLDSDGDGLRNCEDPNDDNQGGLDGLDSCPVHANQVCYRAGSTCPLEPLFFDCRLGGCNDLLIRISSVINPDPTRTWTYAVKSIDARTIVVSAPRDLGLDASARVFAGIGVRAPLGALLVEVVDINGRARGTIALYEPSRATIGSLTGATSLQLRLGSDGQSIDIRGIGL